VPLEGTFSLIAIKCDSVSNAPKCPLNNGVSIVQKLVVKLSNTSTTYSQQVEITFNVILTITSGTNWLSVFGSDILCYDVHSPPCGLMVGRKKPLNV
jgi:hypothetical protein